MELNLNPPQRETAHYAGVMTRRTACIHDCGVQSFKKKTAGEFFFFFFCRAPGVRAVYFRKYSTLSCRELGEKKDTNLVSL